MTSVVGAVDLDGLTKRAAALILEESRNMVSAAMVMLAQPHRRMPTTPVTVIRRRRFARDAAELHLTHQSLHRRIVRFQLVAGLCPDLQKLRSARMPKHRQSSFGNSVPNERGSGGWPVSSSSVEDDSFEPVLVFAPSLILAPDPTIVFMRRLLCGDVVAAEQPIWSMRFDEAERAERHHSWMLAKESEWTYWGRYASAFGSAPSISVIEDGVSAEDEHRAQEQQVALAEAERSAQLHNEISAYIFPRDDGTFCISLEREDARGVSLWEISFRTKGDRERFRDWFREQRNRFHEFADYLSTHTWGDLERTLLKEMLQTEVRVKKAGLGAGGTRPLRYWRGDI